MRTEDSAILFSVTKLGGKSLYLQGQLAGFGAMS